jgi:hypothetical protein
LLQARCILTGLLGIALAKALLSTIIMLTTQGGTNLRLAMCRRLLSKEISLWMATCESKTSYLIGNTGVGK